jgi:uncharacterized DUF497 family protein
MGSITSSSRHIQSVPRRLTALDEERFVLLGLSAGLRVLVVVHCYRVPEDTIWLISARKATPPERRQYAARWQP